MTTGELKFWQATSDLRLLEDDTLQQKFFHVLTGQTVWKDLPKTDENMREYEKAQRR